MISVTAVGKEAVFIWWRAIVRSSYEAMSVGIHDVEFGALRRILSSEFARITVPERILTV